MSDTKIVFLMGVSCSGKSYYAAQLFSEHIHLSMGEYQNRLWDEYRAAGGSEFISSADYRRQLAQANELLLADALERIRAGEPVAIEGTFYKAKRRITFTDAIWGITGEPIDIYLVSPEEEQFEENLRCRGLERDKHTLLKEREQIEFPNRAEGFAHIFELRNGQIEEHLEPMDPGIVAQARAELAAEEQKERRGQKQREILQKLTSGNLWFLHVCEHCGKRELLTPQEAFDAGWDYPPRMGQFGVISPRTCGTCTINHTLWWALTAEKTHLDDLNSTQKETMERILGEPWSLLDESDSGLDLQALTDGKGKGDKPC